MRFASFAVVLALIVPVTANAETLTLYGVGRMVVSGIRAGPLSIADMIVVSGTGQHANASRTLIVTPVHDEGQDTSRLPRRRRLTKRTNHEHYLFPTRGRSS